MVLSSMVPCTEWLISLLGKKKFIVIDMGHISCFIYFILCLIEWIIFLYNPPFPYVETFWDLHQTFENIVEKGEIAPCTYSTLIMVFHIEVNAPTVLWLWYFTSGSMHLQYFDYGVLHRGSMHLQYFDYGVSHRGQCTNSTLTMVFQIGVNAPTVLWLWCFTWRLMHLKYFECRITYVSMHLQQHFKCCFTWRSTHL